MKFYKILSENENHYGLQFHTGRIDDPNEFQEYGICAPGGIYFAPVTSILAFVDYGPWIREVTIPEDAQMVKDPGNGPEKYRASSVILGKRERWEDPEVLRRLIDEGADVQVDGEYPLRTAARYGHTDTVKVLLEHGADVHALDGEALCWAANNGYTETVKVLLENGADVHAHDDEALCCAAEYGYTEAVKVLLEHGADVGVWSNYALRYAEENGHTETVELLKSYMKNNS